MFKLTWELRGLGSLSQNLIKRLIIFCFFRNSCPPRPRYTICLQAFWTQYLSISFDMHIVRKLLKFHVVWWQFHRIPSCIGKAINVWKQVKLLQLISVERSIFASFEINCDPIFLIYTFLKGYWQLTSTYL
jgi:hypothetical protein